MCVGSLPEKGVTERQAHMDHVSLRQVPREECDVEGVFLGCESHREFWASVLLCYHTVLLCIPLQCFSRWLSVTAGQHWFDLGKTVGPEFLENILL